jgi:hypothetical protein
MALALRATTSDLLADVQPVGQVISEQVGAVAISYAPTGQRHVHYPAVDRTLAPLLLDGGSEMQANAALG